jgi:hypothetical protein
VLAARRPAPALWARVLGDALDLGLLAAALRSRRSGRGATLAAAAAVVGVTALDAWTARRLSAPAPRLDGPVEPSLEPAPEPQEERVDESLMESFPASDPPAHQVTDASDRRR